MNVSFVSKSKRVASHCISPAAAPIDAILQAVECTGALAELDPIEHGRRVLERYRHFEVTAMELQAQLSRLVVPLPGFFDLLVGAGVIVPLPDGRCSVNLD